jgi:hypothetical protein
MHPPSELTSDTLSTDAGDVQQPVPAANLVYEGVTLAVMLLLLCSMWVF